MQPTVVAAVVAVVATQLLAVEDIGTACFRQGALVGKVEDMLRRPQGCWAVAASRAATGTGAGIGTGTGIEIESGNKKGTTSEGRAKTCFRRPLGQGVCCWTHTTFLLIESEEKRKKVS